MKAPGIIRDAMQEPPEVLEPEEFLRMLSEGPKLRNFSPGFARFQEDLAEMVGPPRLRNPLKELKALARAQARAAEAAQEKAALERQAANARWRAERDREWRAGQQRIQQAAAQYAPILPPEE